MSADRYLHGAHHPNGECPNGMCATTSSKRVPMVFCEDGGWTETCVDQEHADRQRLFWDRETPRCAPHRVSWEPSGATR